MAVGATRQLAPRKAPQLRIILPAVAVLVFLFTIIGGYAFNWGWTGFRGNTLWDWLQLLILPVVLASGGVWLNFQQTRANGIATTQQHQTDLQIAENQQQEAALEAYLAHMAELLLDKRLKESQPGSGTREVARARTLTVVWRIGKYRKGILLKFLYEAGLIRSGEPVIDLAEADLSHAHLRSIDLRGAYLPGVDLSNADLSGANLSGANLSSARLCGADLSGADLSDADLSGADLSGANLASAILPAGSATRAGATVAASVAVSTHSGTTVP